MENGNLKTPQIIAELDNLEKAVNELDQVASRLMERLQSATTPVPPGPIVTDKKQTVSQYSQIATRISCQNDKILKIINDLKVTSEDLEI